MERAEFSLSLFLSPSFFSLSLATYLRCQPRRQPQAQSVRKAEVRRVLRPERLEMDRQTDRPSAVHFRRLPIEHGDPDLGRRRRVGGREVELEGELVAEEVMDVPAGA